MKVKRRFHRGLLELRVFVESSGLSTICKLPKLVILSPSAHLFPIFIGHEVFVASLILKE